MTLTSITWFLVSSVATSWHSDGALSRRQPGERLHVPKVGSRNVSHLTEVSSTPQVLAALIPLCLIPPAPATILTASEKWPAQLVPFKFQNWIPARLVVPPWPYAPSSGAFSSLERRLPVASDE